MPATADNGLMDNAFGIIGLGILATSASALLFGPTFTVIAGVILGCAALAAAACFKQWLWKRLAETDGW